MRTWKDAEPSEIKQRTCQSCGMLLDDAGEFHPYAFCVWYQAHLEPWTELRWVVEQLGMDISHWPRRPPLTRNLRVAREDRAAEVRLKGEERVAELEKEANKDPNEEERR